MYNQNISITVDCAVFTIHTNKLHIALIQRLLDPYKNMRALPGWFVLNTESLEQAAKRELQEETNIKNLYLEQLYTFSDSKRDPRGRVISCAYIALVPETSFKLRAATDAKDTKLFPVSNLPRLAFDHAEIIAYALQRIKRKIKYTNIAQYLLPSRFTLSALQRIYEIILEEKVDTRNFRKKILTLDIIKAIEKKETGVSHRPSQLYTFTNKKLEIIEIER